MHSLGKTFGKDCMEVEGDKLCKGQIVRTLKEEYRTTKKNRS